ncbi:hypothetical protein MGN70_000824 [Eutypa lata]|nr:hypothetical protein MGN70_000824 [Eutypa lata]
MASKTTYIPRFLLPQHGPLWRSTTRTRTRTFARFSNTSEVGQVLVVRYASRISASAASRLAASTSSRTATPPSRASSSKSAATRAAKHSASTRKASASASTSAPTSKTTTAGAAATPKTPTSRPSVEPNTPAPQPATTAEPGLQKTETSIPDETAAATTPPPRQEANDPSKPIVLEKPERFNPPSHGKRLPRSIPKHYGGAPTAEEAQSRKTKQYPGLPPPDNTWSHWFINSRGVHMFITLGTLSSLALYTFATNFQAKSPYADLIPPLSELPRHPFQYAGVCVDVLRMHEEHESAVTAEKRRRRVDDVQKRNDYRKAHGLEPATGWWGASSSSNSGQAESGAGAGAGAGAQEAGGDDNGAREVGAAAAAAVATAPVPAIGSAEPQPTPPAADLTPEGKRKKFWGIF